MMTGSGPDHGYEKLVAQDGSGIPSAFAIKRKPVSNQSISARSSVLSNSTSGRQRYTALSNSDVLGSDVSVLKEDDAEVAEDLGDLTPGRSTHLSNDDEDSAVNVGTSSVGYSDAKGKSEPYRPTVTTQEIELDSHAQAVQTLRDIFLNLRTAEYRNNERDAELLDIQDSSSSYAHRFDWRPWSLNHVFALLWILVAHLILWIIALAYSNKHGGIATSNPRWDWLFRFGPSFLAVFIKEICARISIDVLSIWPYLALNRRHDQVSSRWVWLGWRSLAQPTSWWITLFSLTLFDVLGLLGTLMILTQATILQYGPRQLNSDRSDFLTIAPNAILEGFAESNYPALATRSWVPNEPVEQNTWFAPWLAGFDSDMSDSNRVAGFGYLALVGLVPYRYTGPKVEKVSYTTSALASRLTCAQVNDFEITLAAGNNSLWSTTIDVNVNGCRLQEKIEDMNFNGQPDYSRGLAANNTLALWRSLRPGLSRDGSTCSSRHIIIAGPMPARPTVGKVSTLKGSGWAAISCEESYWILEDRIPVVRMKTSLSTDVTSNVIVESAAKPLNNASQAAAGVAMKRNFLDTRQIYNFSAALISARYFWGKIDEKVYNAENEPYVKNLMDCKNLQGLSTTFDNPDACMMAINSRYIWSLLFAVSVPQIALYFPSSLWESRVGQVTTTYDIWYASPGPFAGLFFITIFMIALILSSELMLFPQWWPRRLTSAHRTTGLQMNPSSFVGKASLFMDGHTRLLLTDIDAMDQNHAIKETLRRVTNSSLSYSHLRVRREPESSVNPIIQSRQTKGSDYGPRVSLPTDPKLLEKLRYDFEPWQLHPAILSGVFLIFSATVTVFFYIVLPRIGNGFYYWVQYPAASDNSSNAQNARRLQGWFFTLIPQIIVLGLRYWWGKVDFFFRMLQPFVGLYKTRLAKESVCLQYVNDVDGFVTVRAAKNRHWKLAIVTFVSVAIKVALALSGGLLAESEGVYSHPTEVSLAQAWKNGTYVANTGILGPQFRENALRRAAIGYPDEAGYSSSFYLFPELNIDGKMYTATMQGLKANLSCEVVKPSFNLRDSQLTATLDGCGTWTGFCRPGSTSTTTNVTNTTVCKKHIVSSDETCETIAKKENIKIEDLRKWNSNINSACTNLQINQSICIGPGNAKRDTNIGGCTSWKYICDSWWLLDTRGPYLDGQTSVDSSTSLLCKPRFYFDAVNTTIRTIDGKPWITTSNVVSSKALPANYWTNGLTLPAFISSQLEANNYTGTLRQISSSYALDDMSVIAAANSTYATGAFQNVTEFARVASDAFSLVVARLLASNISEGSTMLLDKTSQGPTVPLYPYIQKAYFARTPFIIVSGVLATLALATLVAWPGTARRTALDPSYVMNNVALIYDSSLITSVFNVLARNRDPVEDLADMRFAYGVFPGKYSGRERLGVEVVEKVTAVERTGLLARLRKRK